MNVWQFLPTVVSWTILLSAPAFAQGVLGIDPTGRSGDVPALFQEELPRPEASRSILPPPPEPEDPQRQQLPLVRLFVRKINVEGSTVFSQEELATMTNQYVNREVSAEDLEDLRIVLTRAYIDKGHVNSGAMLPDQQVVDGVITFRILEGELSTIEIDGNRWFRDSYVRRRLAHGAGPPADIHVVQEQLQLLQRDERILKLDADLRPGVRLGEGVLRVHLEEDQPYKLWFGFNNYQSATVGAERGFVTFAHQNVSGYGDRLFLTYGRSDGVNPRIDVNYSLPVTPHDTMVTLQYRKNDFDVIEEPFERLEVESQSDIYGLALRHPLYRTLTHEWAVTLTGEHLRNKTSLLGERFSFSRGSRNGKSVVSAVRLALEWINRTQNQVLAARSRFSVGIDVLGATNNATGTADGQFFSWLGQLQWVRRLGLWGLYTVFRLDLQLSPNPLLSLEQIAIGGRYSVRGYRENQLVRDNGLITSLETRLPLIQGKPWANLVELAPFVDYGHAWNTDFPNPGPKTLMSVGIGLRWNATFAYPFVWVPQFEVYWGNQLRDVETSGGDLQDSGVSLQLIVAAF